jgi:hypothetical protein
MAEDNARYPGENRRAVVARYGPFRVDRLWYRSKPDDAHVYYDVVFEVDASGEFDLGSLTGPRIDNPKDLRRYAFALASLFRRAHSPPPAGRPMSVPYYCCRVGLPDAEHAVPDEEWYQDRFFRRPDRPTIDEDEAATLIETALHELEETEIEKG